MNCTFFIILLFGLWGYWTAATPGLLCQPRVIVKMLVEKQKECRLAGETEVLGENLPQRHFCPSQNPTWPDPGLNPGRRGGKPATNRLSYGAAYELHFLDSSEYLMGNTRWNYFVFSSSISFILFLSYLHIKPFFLC
jgi:hypothetical protein